MRMNLRSALTTLTIAVVTTVAVAPPATSHDVARVKRAIRKAWRGNDRKAIRVAKCESSLDPKATSPSGTYLGLWQFDKPTWKDYGGPGDDPRKVGARAQTKVAWRLFKDRGWQPWPTCGAGGSAATADTAPQGPEGTDARRRSSPAGDTR